MNGSRRRALRWLIETTFRADRRRAALTLIPVSPVIFGVLSVSVRYVIDAATRGDSSEVTTASVVVGLAMLAGFGTGYLQGATTLLRLRESLSLRVDDELVQISLSIVNLDRFERPEIADRLESLRTGKGPLTYAGSLFSQVFNVAAGLLVTAAVLGSVDPPLALLPVAILPVGYVYYRTQVGIDVREAAMAEDRRRALHLFDVGTGPREAKELRVFGAESTIVRRYGGTWRRIDRSLLQVEIRSLTARIAAWTAFCVLVGAALALTAQRERHGTVTAGQAFLVISLIVGLTDTALNLAAIVQQSQQALHLAQQLDELRSEAAEPASALARGTGRVPDRLADGIRLRGLTYHYRGAPRPAIDHVDLDLPPGTTIAVVGENGAGKSTLVKLLAGLVAPSAGSITVDGVALDDLDRDAWYAAVSMVAQDYARFELVLREVVGIGALDHVDNGALVAEATERAGAAGFVGALPGGYDTRLGSRFGGHELSGGEWQRLAVARSMMRRRPLLLLLDEPSASLDALTERHLFDQIIAEGRRLAADNGAVLVLVSHRYATVTNADLIVVLEGGRIVEQGDHAALLRGGGLYADAYRKQADVYR